MGLTKQYLRYKYDAACNIIGTQNGAIQSIDKDVFAVIAAENINFLNIRTGEKVGQIEGTTKMATTIKMSADRKTIAVGYDDGEIRLIRRESEDFDEVVFAGHKTGVNCLAFSEDGLTLASGGKDGSIILWDIVNESGMFRLNGHKASVTQLQFTKDGSYLISSSKDTFVKFWSIASQSCFYTLTDCRSEVYSFALTREDRLLIIGSAEIELRIYELAWKDRIADPKENSNEEVSAKRGLFASDAGASCDDQGNVFLECKTRGTILRQSTGRALQMCVSSDEKHLCCLGGQMIDIYRLFSDAESNSRMVQKVKRAVKKDPSLSNKRNDLTELTDEIAKDVTLLISRAGQFETPDRTKIKWIDFCPGILRLFALYANNSVHGISLTCQEGGNLVTAEDMINLDKLGHRNDVRALAISSTGASFASGASECAMIWNLRSFKPTQTLTAEGMRDITSALFVPGDRHLLLGTKSGKMHIFDIGTNAQLEMIGDAHETAIYGMSMFPDRKGFASVGADKKVNFWVFDLVTEGGQKRMTVLKKRQLLLPDEGTSLQISPDGKFLIVGLLDNTARIYFMDSLKHLSTLYGHSLPVTCVDVSHDSKLVVTGSADKSVKIWGIDFGDCHKTMLAHDDTVTCVMFDKRENLFWSAGKDGKMKQWDAEKFERIQVLNRHSSDVWSLVQTPDSKSMLSASHDKTIRVWELTEEIIVLQEEEEVEREKEYEGKLIELEDVIPGEVPNTDVELAAKKTVDTVRSAENIIDALRIMHEHKVNIAENPKHIPHPLLQNYGEKPLEYFILDTLQKIKSSHLEKSLLMVPLGHIPQIFSALSACIDHQYRAELATRVIMFLVKIHYSFFQTNLDIIPVMDKLEESTVKGLTKIKDMYGFNLMGLRMLHRDIEDRTNARLFQNLHLA